MIVALEGSDMQIRVHLSSIVVPRYVVGIFIFNFQSLARESAFSSIDKKKKEAKVIDPAALQQEKVFCLRLLLLTC